MDLLPFLVLLLVGGVQFGHAEINWCSEIDFGGCTKLTTSPGVCHNASDLSTPTASAALPGRSGYASGTSRLCDVYSGPSGCSGRTVKVDKWGWRNWGFDAFYLKCN